MCTNDRKQLSEAYNAAEDLAEVCAVCPACGGFNQIQLHHRDQGKGQKVDGVPVGRVQYGCCSFCKSLIVAVKLTGPPGSRLLWPQEVLADRAPASVEPEIKSDYDEARHVLAFSAKASAALSRRCLQHVLRKKLGIKNATLEREISEARTREEFSKPTRDALDHVRRVGNWAAHPTYGRGEQDTGRELESPDADPALVLIEVTPKEARYTLEVVELVFRDLYDLPSRFKNMEERLARKGESEVRK